MTATKQKRPKQHLTKIPIYNRAGQVRDYLKLDQDIFYREMKIVEANPTNQTKEGKTKL